MQTQTMHIVIRERKGTLWEGDAASFSSTNQIGNFDILPEHAHFVGLVEQFIEIRFGETKKRWEIEHGLVNVRDAVVDVYLGY